jgi:hypothetical protein
MLATVEAKLGTGIDLSHAPSGRETRPNTFITHKESVLQSTDSHNSSSTGRRDSFDLKLQLICRLDLQKHIKTLQAHRCSLTRST